jgi:hypothetical protein
MVKNYEVLTLGLLFVCPSLLFPQAPGTGGTGSAVPEATVDRSSTPPPDSSRPTLIPLTPGQKASRRSLRLVEPVTLLSSAFGAGIDQLRNSPGQWGQGVKGFAIRFGSAEGYTAAHNGVALGFDLAFHLDPRYRPLPRGKFTSRVWNAVSQTFIANTDDGGKAFNVSEIAGNFGAGFISNAWEPQGHNSIGDALTRGATGLLFHSVRNLAREFLPDLLHRGKNVTPPVNTHN